MSKFHSNNRWKTRIFEIKRPMDRSLEILDMAKEIEEWFQDICPRSSMYQHICEDSWEGLFVGVDFSAQSGHIFVTEVTGQYVINFHDPVDAVAFELRWC